MTLHIEKSVRKVRPVEAVKVTEDNLSEIAGWTRGLVVAPPGLNGENTTESYVFVHVRNQRRPEDSQAFPGMWVIKEDHQFFRVVNQKQYKSGYEPFAPSKPTPPSPASMPKKMTPQPKQVGAVEVVPGTPPDGDTKGLTTGRKEVHRSAIDGQFVDEATADANPATTVTETVQVGVDDAYEKMKENEMSEMNADELAGSSDVLHGDEMQADVVPGDMRDLEQAEEDPDGTVQLGAPIETRPEVDGAPELCGQCGSPVNAGTWDCTKDASHDVTGSATGA